MAVLVTRPAHQNKDLIKALQTAKYQYFTCPAIQIETLHSARQSIDMALRHPCDAFIFVSVNAANIGLQLLSPYRSILLQSEIFTIGLSTHKVLKEWINHIDKTIHCAPAPYRSESLLSLFQLNQRNIAGKTIIIIAGENGRTLIRDRLKNLGALVQTLAVYKSTQVDDLTHQLAKLKHNISVLTAMSAQTLENLDIAIKTAQLDTWYDLPLIVPGDRVQKLADQLGYRNIYAIEYPNNQLILQAIQQIKPKFHDRF